MTNWRRDNGQFMKVLWKTVKNVWLNMPDITWEHCDIKLSSLWLSSLISHCSRVISTYQSFLFQTSKPMGWPRWNGNVILIAVLDSDEVCSSCELLTKIGVPSGDATISLGGMNHSTRERISWFKLTLSCVHVFFSFFSNCIILGGGVG